VLIDFVELVLGLVAVKTLGIMPWNYSHHILNFEGLISLPITIRWVVIAIFFVQVAYGKIEKFMKDPLSKKIKNLTIITLVVYVIYLLIRILFM
jgi:uncharacterized membrane protein